MSRDIADTIHRCQGWCCLTLRVSKARLVITAVVVEGRSPSEVARSYGVARSWVYELVARYRAEGDTAFEARSRRRSPHRPPSPARQWR